MADEMFNFSPGTDFLPRSLPDSSDSPDFPDLLDFSPLDFGFSSEQISAPIDIPYDINGNVASHAFSDDREEQILEAQNQEVDRLVAKFTKGFDPSTLRGEIMSRISDIDQNLFPGSYNHLLLLLFKSDDAVQHIQLKMEDWVTGHLQGAADHPHRKTDLTEEKTFAFEIEYLRLLLEPLHERGSKNPIYWLNGRRNNPTYVLKELKSSIEVIKLFKRELCSIDELDKEQITIYSNLDVSDARTAFISSKQLRLDGCKDSLSWDFFSGAYVELTTFYYLYKRYLVNHYPDKARGCGWLPPTFLEPPRMSTEKIEEGDLASWPTGKPGHEIYDVLLKIALWLSLARGYSAVHLFCDTVRLFGLYERVVGAKDDYLSFLQYLTRLRACEPNYPPSPLPVVPRRDQNFPSRNVDYFDDLFLVGHKQRNQAYRNPTLIVRKNTSTFNLAPPPRRPRNANTQPGPQIYGTLAGNSSKIETSTTDQGATHEAATGVSLEEKKALSNLEE